jgi:hypothetical protein
VEGKVEQQQQQQHGSLHQVEVQMRKVLLLLPRCALCHCDVVVDDDDVVFFAAAAAADC